MRLFYDHLINRSTLLALIDREAKTKKERESLLRSLDELLHHAVLDVIFYHLDEKHHEEFLLMLHETPQSQELLIYLREKAHPQIEEKMREEVEKLSKKILGDLTISK